MSVRSRWKSLSLTTRRLIILVPAALVVVVVILIFPLGMMLMRGFPAQPLPSVSTIIAKAEPWQSQAEVVGTLSASRGADLAVEMAGVVDQVFYTSGGEVRAGQQLLSLRSQDDVARLRTLQAAAELAAARNTRNQRLWDIQGISQAEIEAGAAGLKSAQAAVAEQNAIVAKKVVRAPFPGRVGIRNVNVGQYVQPGTVVATLQALDPINMDFRVPQQMLQQLQVGQAIEVRVDAYPNDVFHGKVETIDPKVDTATRNVAVRATLPNPGNKLLPGMYATARIETGVPKNYVTLPQTAVTFNPYGNVVFRVEEQTVDNKKSTVVRQTFVTSGETRGDQIAIVTGVKEGDVVVSAGQFKLQNGAPVTINNAVQPSNDSDPRPVDR